MTPIAIKLDPNANDADPLDVRRLHDIAAIVAASIAICNVAACASSTGAKGAPVTKAVALAAATKLAAPPAAVHYPDAPGLNVDDLSARLRNAVARTSGVDVVDEVSVKRELAACTEAPCPDDQASKYRDANFIIASSVSRIGDVFLTTVRIERGTEELVRTTAQAADARVSVETAGLDAGAQLRAKLVAEGVAEATSAPPPSTTTEQNGTERGGDG